RRHALREPAALTISTAPEHAISLWDRRIQRAQRAGHAPQTAATESSKPARPATTETPMPAGRAMARVVVPERERARMGLAAPPMRSAPAGTVSITSAHLDRQRVLS